MNDRRPFSLITVFLLAGFCSLPSVIAQTATATLTGIVVDQNGAVVNNAAITVENIGTALKRETITNDEGYFSVPLLPPATYAVTVQRAGFVVTRIETVVLNVGDQKALKIQLKTGGAKETVVITGEAPLINESPAVGTVVDRQFVANMPLNGRTFQSLITLTPGVVTVPGAGNQQGQFSVNGQRPDANYFVVDGVSGNFAASPQGAPGAQTSGSLPGLTTFGTTQSLVSVDALQEFRVQTSTYAAEFGRQPGGQISLVTRSGGNEFHGALFDYLRNDVLDATDWFVKANRLAKPPMRQNDFGGTFSGPVLPRFGEGGRQPGYNGHNRTFFFFSYEGLRLRQPRFALANVPSLALRQQAPQVLQPLLNGFPVPSGRDLGTGLAELSGSYSDPSTLNAASIRVDHTVNQKWMLFGRYNFAPSQSVSRDSTELTRIFFNDIRTQTVTIGVTTYLSARTGNEFRINYSHNGARNRLALDSFGGAIPPPRSALIPSQYDSSTAQGGMILILPGATATPPTIGLTGDGFNASQRQFNSVDNFSHSHGQHQFKFGVDYRRLTPIFAVNSYLLLSEFTSMQQVLSATAVFGFVGAQAAVRPVYVNFSAYGQDSWKISGRLTVNLGIRWEVNPAPGESTNKSPLAVNEIDNLATMRLAPIGTSLWKTTYNNLAPRVGVAYQLKQQSGRETLLRGGFGVYHDTGNNQGSSEFFNSFPFNPIQIVPNIAYPLSPHQVAPPPLPSLSSLTPPYGTIIVFDANLKIPYTLHWNMSLERALGGNQVVTISYVGAAGRRLLQQRQINLSAINPSFTTIKLNANRATSDYHALQAQYRHRLSRGLQAVASYTWSHALDDDSTDFGIIIPVRGNADFDIRHLASAAIMYDLPMPGHNRALKSVFGGWSMDGRLQAQSAAPIDIIASRIVNPVDGTLVGNRPILIPGIPLYLYGPQYPGGRTINDIVPTAAQIAAAGCSPTGAAKGPFCTPPTGKFGNLGRNVVRGFGEWQIDAALRRQFKLTERATLQFRAEAFNVFNHPNFGAIQTSLAAANFGQATNMLNQKLVGLNPLYQIGGPRSIQFALKLQF